MVLMDLKRATGRMPFMDMEWVQVRAHSRRSNCSFKKSLPAPVAAEFSRSNLILGEAVAAAVYC